MTALCANIMSLETDMNSFTALTAKCVYPRWLPVFDACNRCNDDKITSGTAFIRKEML